MLCTWAWLDYFKHYLGDYQSDTDDLKAFMRRYARQVYALYCRRSDGRQYLWLNPLTFNNGGWISL